MYYFPYFYYQQRPISYYPYPDPFTFDPYKVELPKIIDPRQRCRRKCIALGYQPQTMEWYYCMQACNSLLGTMLDDPQFVEDMLAEGD